MKKFFLQFIFATLLIGVSVALAQREIESDVGSDSIVNVIDGNPYKIGENFTFEAKYKKFGLSFTVADFKFLVEKPSDGNNIQIKSVGTSRGTLVKLFGFKFLQKIDSTVEAGKNRILETTKKDVQKKRIRDSVAEFDYDKSEVRYVETDPNDPSRPPRRVASTIPDDTQDVVTAVYMLRRMPLAIGKRFVIKISDSGLVYDVPVNVTAREKKKSILGKLWCWKIEPEIFGEGRFIEQKGSFTIWITDDARRIPVRAKLNTKFGGVGIKLKKMNVPRIPQKKDN